MNINNPRLVTHNTQDRSEVIQRFKKSREPLVLVSPSCERGLSLDDDQCRFIIFAKAPFLSLNDKKTSP
jgi:Rad3-related DNA helicase